MAVTPWVSQLHGGGRVGDAGAVVRQALWIGVCGGATLAVLLQYVEPVFRLLGVDERARYSAAWLATVQAVFYVPPIFTIDAASADRGRRELMRDSCGDSHEAWPSVDRGDSHQNGATRGQPLATRGQPLGTGQPLGQPSMGTQSLYSSQNRQVALHVLREALTDSVARRVAAARRRPRFDFLRGTMSRIPQLTAQPRTNGPQLNRPAAAAPFDEHAVANSRRL